MNSNKIKTHREDMNVVFVGHVDHGKSTIIGRMLADTDSLPKGKLDQVRESCRRNSKPFEYAFLLDALKDEQAQGITIDAARCFFQTAKRRYIIIDAPGHIEFLKNMVTGAARAEAAILVIDAHEGVQENSKRHGYLLAMLGIRQIAVAVNKMDLVDFKQDVFEKIKTEYSDFLSEIGLEADIFIPVSGMEGDNVAALSEKMNWYSGLTVLQQLDAFRNIIAEASLPFRMPVQDVYKFTRNNDERRIVSGKIEAGIINDGDEITFYPSGKTSQVRRIESFPETNPEKAEAGWNCGFTIEKQIYIKRGEIACKTSDPPPSIATRLKTNIFWLGRQSLVRNKEYILKLGTAKIKFTLEEVTQVIDASTLQKQSKKMVERHDVAECVLLLNQPLAFESIDKFASLSRFVIVDNYEISGGGIITESLSDRQDEIRKKVRLRNYKWIEGAVSLTERSERFSQNPHMIIITGSRHSGRKSLARALEKHLFQKGRLVYYLGLGNVLYGVDADLEHEEGMNRTEHFRRLAEISHILMDAGLIVVVTAVELNQDDMEILRTVVDPAQIDVIWVAGEAEPALKPDMIISDMQDFNKALTRIKTFLQKKQVIFEVSPG